MSCFIQLHILTTYPACNLNRDDLGRPKTVNMGGAERLRISSQSLKRAWRTSPYLADHAGVRTKAIGRFVYRALTNGVSMAEAMQNSAAKGDLPLLKHEPAENVAHAIAGIFAKGKKSYTEKGDAFDDKKFLDSLDTEQMVHLNPVELAAVGDLVEACRATGKVPDKKDQDLLRKEDNAVDVAMFGRMLASQPKFNVEAAVQVAHAMTVHKGMVEDDFFTAVDDLNRDDLGAGHMGVTEFGSGLFYLYVCINRDLLQENLGGDIPLSKRALEALVRAAVTVSPSGKQNSFASRALASYCLAEKGHGHPRTLAEAFLTPFDGKEDMLAGASLALTAKRESFNTMVGDKSEAMEYGHGRQTLDELCAFVTE